ncbi:PREDICTED: solute carrier family 41 member 1-like isoform X2 [Amphimedon queenslandica]|uniref:SLC41A/MgtE integral membrane domain-containing protein n=1 Tax=Amphimedon queenslandica TaxID=400682 RepID=A0A1X7VK61_AMPQE|nr:PREDICTED: solute carrier family 41 member 1-like isoform X2 [Amphimedon queenslandica]|eukprot:XP_003384010.3 PREDICTED: solute carrier family 41 member 1-like isoform X2 [Amphimedon queenslandica]
MKKKEEVTVRRRSDSINSEVPVEGGSTSSSEQNANDSEDDSGISDQSNPEISTLVIINDHSGTHTKYADENPGLFKNFIQIFFPFLIAGAGMMLAGILLDYVQHLKVFVEVSELFILVPALLGLKGNLEMTLASRLSTSANLGNMDTCKDRWLLTWGNLSLIQGQALVVALVATLTSIMLSGIGGQHLYATHILLIGGSSMSAACLASAILSSLMIVIVLLSRPLQIDPDNVATPIAASLGDLVTLCILSGISYGLYRVKDETVVISSILCGVLLILIPFWLCLAYYNTTTRSVLYSGWIPVLSAMLISSIGGFILSKTVSVFPGIAIYSPIINGIGGNLAAVQASRISTHLHKGSNANAKSTDYKYKWNGICGTFWKGYHTKTSILLLIMVVPGSSLFLVLIHYIKAGHTTLSALFFISYLIVAIMQVAILLIFTDWMVHFIFWRLSLDPDNIAIPFITALGDFLGTGLLAGAFHILWLVGDRDSDVGD